MCRVQVAITILETDESQLHLTAQKVRKVCLVDLEYIKTSGGKCTVRLQVSMRLVIEKWRCDNQEIEGIMNLIKCAIMSSTTIRQELVDARVGNRKDIGLSFWVALRNLC